MCNKSEPEAIAKISPALPERDIRFTASRIAINLNMVRDLGARFAKNGDGYPRFYISSRCVNAISELLEYNVEVKERDHAVDAMRYGIAVEVQK